MRKRRISPSAIFVVLFMSIAASFGVATPALATGPTIELQHSNLQVRERTLLYPDTICPNAATGEANAYVYGTFTDSGSQVFSNLFIGYSVANGSWSSGSFVVPAGAALGSGSLEVYCTQTPGGGSPNRVLDPVAVTVVGQTTGVTVDRVNIWHEAHFTSVTACEPNVPVDIQLHDQGNQIMSGDLGATSYGLEITDTVTSDSSGAWTFSQQLTPGEGFSNPGYLYTLRATCRNSSGDYEHGSYNFALKADQYVALGDSYSSGLGAFTYYEPSGCMRSFDGYPFEFAIGASLDPPNQQACAGAVTQDVVGTGLMPPGFLDGQVQSLTTDTEVVTITVGGNDIGFAEVMGQCVDYLTHPGYGCAADGATNSSVASRVSKLAGFGSATSPGGTTISSYVDTLNAIATHAPNAKIYIAGYPTFFGEDTSNYVFDLTAPGDYRCVVYSGTTTFVNVSYNDALWINGWIDNLNEVIEGAVATIDSPNVVYVSPSTFDGHGLCDSGTSYLNGVIRNAHDGAGDPESFHPTVDGMSLGYAVAFLDAMD